MNEKNIEVPSILIYFSGFFFYFYTRRHDGVWDEMSMWSKIKFVPMRNFLKILICSISVLSLATFAIELKQNSCYGNKSTKYGTKIIHIGSR